jgi:peptide deformylase
MVREIIIWPDPVLKQIAKPVDRVDDTIRRLLDDMAETMYAADGVGLAAPQIAVGKRLIVIDTSPRQEGQKLIHLVNPEIVRTEGRTSYTEGCLSIPGEAEDVERYAKVWVRALDRAGKPFEI